MKREGNTYWNMKGKYQEYAFAVSALIPYKGKASNLHLDLFRNTVRLYHDYYTNGGDNFGDCFYLDLYHLMYHADELESVAVDEGEPLISRLLERIFGGFGGKVVFNESLTHNLEKLADIVARYAWEKEHSND